MTPSPFTLTCAVGAVTTFGRGGPQITFEGVNGDVDVLRGDN